MIRKLGADALIVGGIADHVHMLVMFRGSHCIADLVRETKKASTAWMSAPHRCPEFAWQEGYGAFTVGKPEVSRVVSYISNQEAHHRNVGSADELEKFLEEFGVKYDKRFFQ